MRAGVAAIVCGLDLQDLIAWLSAHDFLDRTFYLGVILTAVPGDERWWDSQPHAWVVRHDGYLKRPVASPPRCASDGRVERPG